MEKENVNYGNSEDYNSLLAFDIINNNFAVQSVFDDVPENLISSKNLSKTKADELCKTHKRGRYQNYRVAECLAIVGIVPFNQGLAYIFNKQLYNSEASDNITIISKAYEELMDCYVFGNERISKKTLQILENEYYKRGGVVYSDYHAFEDLELKKVREERKRQFRNTIVFDSIFKHEFREVGKLNWSNGIVKIKQKTIQRSSIKYPSYIKHTELDTTLQNKILIGSLFAGYYDHINQLSKNVFGIICKTKNSSQYNFAYFEITLN